MDHDPETSFERDLICEDDEMFQLSTDNMRSLATLLQEVICCYVIIPSLGIWGWEKIRNVRPVKSNRLVVSQRVPLAALCHGKVTERWPLWL